ncbi:hypothetical protein F3Y22_tig00110716pilonHSYRG00003 [Hibiscus syriacus]|uniref:Uncharacterized protein n=1 Tax=Hibiscus syriacus TaxID=106335 RepID=A0A6A2ZW79_HIBSY|nr:hypothetical protein F3Y22_tig00110716pilonHSYRG00003 [Hibiscus syriacus]
MWKKNLKKGKVEVEGDGFRDAFLELLTNIFTVLSSPSFTLIYPLFASIRIVQTNSSLKNQQCLMYWVLFALITMVELTLGVF